jgi:transcriptional regulator with XRE-family HTH domain
VATSSQLSDALKRRRQEQRLTLEQLAAKSGVSRAAISKIERGDSGASTPVLDKLAEALDLSISQLVGEPPGAPVLHIPHDKQPSFVAEETASSADRSRRSIAGAASTSFSIACRRGPRRGPFPSHRQGV